MNPGPPNPNANVLWDLGPHDIALLLLLAGQDPHRIKVWAKGYHTSIPQAAQLCLEFKNGLTTHIHLSWLTANKTRIFEAFGGKGYLIYDDLKPDKKIQIFGPPIDNRLEEKIDEGSAFTYKTGEINTPDISSDEPLYIEASQMVKSIKSGTRPKSNGELGLRVVRVIEKVCKLIDS